MNRPAAVAALLFTMAAWGVGPLFIRSATLSLGPSESLVIRHVLSSLLYIVLLTAIGGWSISRRDWPRLLLVSWVGMFGYNLGSVFGFQWVPAGIGGLIIGTQPLLIAILAVLLTGERMTLAAVAGCLTALAGTVLLFWRDLATPGENAPLLVGAVLIFLSGLAWSFYVVMTRPLVAIYGSPRISALTIMLATLPMLLFARPSTWTTFVTMDRGEIATMFYLVVIATFISAITWNYGAARLSATAAGVFLYLVPAIAVAAGWLWFDEPVTREVVLGGLLILAGVAITQLGAKAR